MLDGSGGDFSEGARSSGTYDGGKEWGDVIEVRGAVPRDAYTRQPREIQQAEAVFKRLVPSIIFWNGHPRTDPSSASLE